jgi:hypothetical protein
VTEGVEHAFMGKDAIGDRQFFDQSIQSVKHDVPRFGEIYGPGAVAARPVNQAATALDPPRFLVGVRFLS